MGEWLFDKWLEEEVEDVSVALALDGVRGLLINFESWLDRNNHLRRKDMEVE